ncbi:MAG: nucleoid-associated protein, YbaB/EbfC family [Acidobacteria bacterium RIFCSPLOWO2_02_FULL_61_28]|nr:MAG: nucleoid-associated protein, YbaB/EbfC family [Acidobacteria bacterium RIFCSPLOWO2_02_FULL_61_28]
MRNLQQMMQQVKKMQEELQQQMESLRVEASSGGGMVTVRMNGAKRVLSVKIDPEALKNSDAEMLQDLVQAAVNQALRQVDEAMADKLGGLTGGLTGGMKIPGLS